MMLQLPAVLDREQLQSVARVLSGARFVDGKLTAGAMAREVKRNQELDRTAEHRDVLNRAVMGALYQHPQLHAAALPLRVATPLFARYTPGMTYGDHTDDPVMGDNPPYRCDIAVTLFLNDPAAYDGGELVVRTSFGLQQVKLPAGDAVLYPASSLHRVAEVTRGERLVMVTWIQSMVRDPARRELLYELKMARDALMAKMPGADETLRVDAAYVNLVRMWAEV